MGAFIMPSRLTNHHWRALLLLLFAALLACGSRASSASDDHERARQALEAGATAAEIARNVGQPVQ